MAAAKSLNTISKLLGVTGETSDAVSAYTRVKMTEALRLLRLPLEVCLEIWIRIVPRQKKLKVGIRLKTTWYILNGTFMVIHVAAFFGKAKIFFLKRAESQIVSLDARLRVDDLPPPQFGSVRWKHCPVD